MLDDSTTPGHTLCVFCRMEARPTIWSVVDNVLNTEHFDDDNDQFIKGEHTADETSAERIEESDASKKI